VTGEPDPLVSAQVVLSDPEGVDSASRFFSEAGFETDPVVGISFSIAGPRSLFERVFGDRLEPTDRGGWVAGGGPRELKLSLARLPDDVASAVEAVTFSSPPAFPSGRRPPESS
jgi:hypothetical protein